MKKSLHILADFYGCSGNPAFLTAKGKTKTRTLGLVRRSGFKIVASRFHKFPATSEGEGGITGVIIVSESHLTIHTWPERKFINLDVFFCNYSRDNTKKARAVFNEIKRLYHPKKIRIREVWRD